MGAGAPQVLAIFLPLSGSSQAIIDDGVLYRSFALSDPNVGLLVPPLIFVDLEGFSTDVSVLLLASEPYDRAEYIGTREELKDIRLAATWARQLRMKRPVQAALHPEVSGLGRVAGPFHGDDFCNISCVGRNLVSH